MTTRHGYQPAGGEKPPAPSGGSGVRRGALHEADDIEAILVRFRRFLADPACDHSSTLAISLSTTLTILDAMKGATVVADHAGGRIRELEAEIARLKRIDDERHERVCAHINRRVAVEDQLWLIEKGKRGPIEKGEARELALRLGVPEWFNEVATSNKPASGSAVGG